MPRAPRSPPASHPPLCRACHSVADSGGGNPELVVRRENAVAAADEHRQSRSNSALRLGQRLAEHRQPSRASTSAALRPGQPQGRLARQGSQRHQFHIVHDDEVVEVGQQAVVLIGGNLQFQIVLLCARPSGRPGCVPAHSAPGSMRRRSAARSFTVLVTMPLSQRKRSSPRTATRRSQPRSWTAAPWDQRRYFARSRVQLQWGQRAAIGGEFRLRSFREARIAARAVAVGDAATVRRRSFEDFPRFARDFAEYIPTRNAS